MEGGFEGPVLGLDYGPVFTGHVLGFSANLHYFLNDKV